MTSIDWDRGRIYSADLLATQPKEDSITIVEQKFTEFLKNFRFNSEFIYREQIRNNVNSSKYSLQINMNDLVSYNESLASLIQNNPSIYFPVAEQAARSLARSFHHHQASSSSSDDSIFDPFASFHLTLTYSTAAAPVSAVIPMSIRELSSSHVSKLVRIPGIIISASAVVSKPSQVYIMCKNCFSHRIIPVNSSFGSIQLPRTCSRSDQISDGFSTCPIDPYFIVPEKSVCVDQQTLKLQESPDMVPVGELPRHVLLTVDRTLVNEVTPGSKVIVCGIFSIFQSAKNSRTPSSTSIRSPYVKVLGLENFTSSNGHDFFTEEDEREMIRMSKTPNLLNLFARSIAPSIYGNDDIKLALACLLFGGSRKFLPDGMKIRGDVNILLLGDPGVAKSQFLKFIEKVSPISVYTSGKGSSAAGLTASVNRDAGNGEFYLEGGAMVLADGGVVCIDEFDKMNEEDRVAIHEAMEQQTISIAKAGITTILNSRTSVLAAANPLFGRYDELKSPGDNIDFSTTILSRFDMIFILKDEHDLTKDTNLAKHVLSVHVRPGSSSKSSTDLSNNMTDDGGGGFDLQQMKKYIRYCKATCSPRLSRGAAEKLVNHYVSIRGELQSIESDSLERSSIPITVRQLEAIVRISEALAKITLSPVAEEKHVDEAIRLFRVSTMQAVLSGHSLEGMTRPDLVKQVEKIERVMKERVAIGSTVSLKALLKEMTENKGFPEHSVLRCIDLLVKQEKFMLRSQQKIISRIA